MKSQFMTQKRLEHEEVRVEWVFGKCRRTSKMKFAGITWQTLGQGGHCGGFRPFWRFGALFCRTFGRRFCLEREFRGQSFVLWDQPVPVAEIRLSLGRRAFLARARGHWSVAGSACGFGFTPQAPS